jgi:hypothetical protein
MYFRMNTDYISSWNTSEEGLYLTIFVRKEDLQKLQLDFSSLRLFSLLAIFTTKKLCIEIWSQKMSYWMKKVMPALLISVWLDMFNQVETISQVLSVAPRSILHQKFLTEKATEWLLIGGLLACLRMRSQSVLLLLSMRTGIN